MTDLERKLTAFRPVWEYLGAPAARLRLPNSQRLVRDARRLKQRGMLETRYHGGCLQWRLSVDAPVPAPLPERPATEQTEPIR